MKISVDRLNEQLNKSLSPVYLISGDETLLVEEAVQLIRKTAQKQGYNDREVWHVESGFNWHQLLETANSLSLFSNRSLLEMRLRSNKLNETAKTVLLEYLENPPDDKILVLITGKCDGSTQKSKWLKAIEKIGVFAQAWPITPQQFPHWIKSRLTQATISADHETIRFIAEHTEGNLLAAQQEIEKLALLYAGKRLTIEDVMTAVHNNARYDIFSLVDSALTGDAKRTLRILSGLQAEGIDPILILWAITKDIRALVTMSTQLKKGLNIAAVLQNNGVWEKRKPIMRSALQRHDKKSLSALLKKASKADRIIKGVRQGNIWDVLSQICVELAIRINLHA